MSANVLTPAGVAKRGARRAILSSNAAKSTRASSLPRVAASSAAYSAASRHAATMDSCALVHRITSGAQVRSQRLKLSCACRWPRSCATMAASSSALQTSITVRAATSRGENTPTSATIGDGASTTYAGTPAAGPMSSAVAELQPLPLDPARQERGSSSDARSGKHDQQADRGEHDRDRPDRFVVANRARTRDKPEARRRRTGGNQAMTGVIRRATSRFALLAGSACLRVR